MAASLLLLFLPLFADHVMPEHQSHNSHRPVGDYHVAVMMISYCFIGVVCKIAYDPITSCLRTSCMSTRGIEGDWNSGFEGQCTVLIQDGSCHQRGPFMAKGDGMNS